MQQRADIQKSFLCNGGYFDMWHDYMNLSKLLSKPSDQREVDLGVTEEPKKEPAAQWIHIQIPAKRRNSKNSTESGSSSSLSDTSCGSTSGDYCRFCKQNGESTRVYRSHTLRSDDGKILCPILQNYTCPICGATGEHAHTRRYCPHLKQQEDEKMLPSFKFW